MQDGLTERLWPWLPVFRAVAESEHLPTAAARLHLTTPALSRTVRLVEETLGQPLFDRVGRRLVLNAAGRVLLGQVRAAMREVNDGLAAITTAPFAGPLRVSALGVLTNDVVLPILMDLKTSWPDLEPRLENLRTAEAHPALLRGSLDLAFYYEPLTAEGLVVRPLGVLTAAVHCGRGHPLFGVAADLQAMADHEYSVPAIGDSGQVMDGWPVALPRRIGMRITLLTSNLQAALSGRFLTVLPDLTAAPAVARGDLWRLPPDVVPPIPVFVAHRPSLRQDGAAAALIARVEAVLAAAAPGKVDVNVSEGAAKAQHEAIRP